MKANGLLHNIYYVDLLNEYPLFHGFSRLTKQLDRNLQQQEERFVMNSLLSDQNG